MLFIKNSSLLLALTSAITSFYVSAELPHTFSAGTPAKASEVNANFADVESKATEAQAQATIALDSVASTASQITGIETNLSNLTANVTSLETSVNLLENSPVTEHDHYVEINVNCSENSEALIDAYNANASAHSITFNITGVCEGDYQGGEASATIDQWIQPTPHITLNEAADGAKIVANSSTGLVNIKASLSTLVINGVDIEAGALEYVPVLISDNANLFVNNSVFTGTAETGYLIFVTRSSSIQAHTVEFHTGTTGIRINDSSYGRVHHFTSTGLERSFRVTAAAATLAGVQDHSRININNGQLMLASDAVLNTTQLDVYSSKVIQYSSTSIVASGRVTITEGSHFLSRDLTITDGDFYVHKGSSYRGNGPFTITGDGNDVIIEEGSSAKFEGGPVAMTNLNVKEGSFVYLEGDGNEGVQINISGWAVASMSTIKLESTTIESLSSVRGSTVYLVEDNNITNHDVDETSNFIVNDNDNIVADIE